MGEKYCQSYLCLKSFLAVKCSHTSKITNSRSNILDFVEIKSTKHSSRLNSYSHLVYDYISIVSKFLKSWHLSGLHVVLLEVVNSYIPHNNITGNNKNRCADLERSKKK